MNYAPLRGLIAAPFTAFNPDSSINLDAIEAQASSLVKNGVTGAFIGGTTGESTSLTIQERQWIAERWRAVAPPQLRVIIHVGTAGLADSRILAAHAQGIGADAIGCIAPFFFKPANVDVLVEYCAQVAAAAPNLPFYYYHMPSMTGVNFSVLDFLKAAAPRIPNLVGVKFTFENLMDFLQCLHFEGGRFEMVFGRDEALLAGLATGAQAAIGSTYNFAAPIYNRLIAAFARGDLDSARREQLRSAELIQLLVGYGFFGAAKATMKMTGIDVGPTRLPNTSLGKEQTDRLAADLTKMGFFEWVK